MDTYSVLWLGVCECSDDWLFVVPLDKNGRHSNLGALYGVTLMGVWFLSRLMVLLILFDVVVNFPMCCCWCWLTTWRWVIRERRLNIVFFVIALTISLSNEEILKIWSGGLNILKSLHTHIVDGDHGRVRKQNAKMVNKRRLIVGLISAGITLLLTEWPYFVNKRQKTSSVCNIMLLLYAWIHISVCVCPWRIYERKKQKQHNTLKTTRKVEKEPQFLLDLAVIFCCNMMPLWDGHVFCSLLHNHTTKN